jgi:hypothetical protein
MVVFFCPCSALSDQKNLLIIPDYQAIELRAYISYINVQKSTDFKPQEMKERKKEF